MKEMYCAEQPARCSVFPGEPFIQHTHTHGSMLSILFLAVVAIMAVRTNYSARSSICVVASAKETLHGSQHYWSKPVGLPLYVRAPVCTGMPFPFPLVCAFGERVCSGTRGTSESRQRCCLWNWYHLSWMWWRMVEAAGSWKHPNTGKMLVVGFGVE